MGEERVTDIDGVDLISPRAYGERGVPHDQWTHLRRLDRLHFCGPPGFDSFYPIVRHEHICEISKQPDRFLNRFGIVLESSEQKIALKLTSSFSIPQCPETRLTQGVPAPDDLEAPPRIARHYRF